MIPLTLRGRAIILGLQSALVVVEKVAIRWCSRSGIWFSGKIDRTPNGAK